MTIEDPDSDLPSSPAFDDMRAVRRRSREAQQKADRDLNNKTTITPADIASYERYQLRETARDIRQHERLVKGIESLRDRDINTYFERGFDRHYARLTGQTT